MNSPKLSLAINCLLWLFITPRYLCDAGMLHPRRDHLSSELGARQQHLSGSKEFDVAYRVLEKREESTGDRTNPKNTGSRDPKDPQNSLDLSSLAVQEASKKSGKEKPEQSPSLTSPNNFINFCISGAGRLGDAVIMNGKQTKKANTCNGIPMGMIPAPDKTPSLRFFSPKNLDTVPAKKTFTLSISVKNLDAGHFTAPLETYFSAPTQLNKDAVVIGHTHVVAQRVESLTSTALLDPLKFAFFKDDVIT